MSYRKRVEKKIKQKEKSYEITQLMKHKRSEEMEVLEEVFDRSTLMTIYEFLNKGTIDEIGGVVKAGKEARIYRGKAADGNEIAIKIFLTISGEFKKGMLPYIVGDPRFTHVRRDTRSLVYAWAQKEFKNLQRATEAGVRVPHPIAVKKNVLIMEFIGKKGVSAPVLKDSPLKNPRRVYNQLLIDLRKLYQEAKLVHADLSEYNIMMWADKPVLFDLSQATPLEHPMADQFLRRDLENLNRYFRKLNLDVLPLEKLCRRITNGKS